MKFLFVLSSLFFILIQNVQAAEIAFDPYFWLEEVEGQKAMEWVRQQNASTVATLEKQPEFEGLLADMQAILFAKDRLPFSSFSRGYFYNTWQDQDHKQGIIRRTTLEEYKKAQPTWETILDLDELSKKENEEWILKDSTKLSDHSSRRLLRLSRGGKDATVIREFDYETKQFITDGFNLPESKCRISAIDENHIIVGTDYGDGSLTESGYPRILKLWKRGEPLSHAKTVFEIQSTDVAANAWTIEDGGQMFVFYIRRIDFFNTEVFFQNSDGSIRLIKAPPSATLQGFKNGQLYYLLKEPLVLKDRTLPNNSIVRFALDDVAGIENAQVLFTSNEKQSIEGVTLYKQSIVINLLDNIRSKVIELKLNNAVGQRSLTAVLETIVFPFPDTGIIEYSGKDENDPTDFTVIEYTDHLTPRSQYIVHDEDGSYRLELLKSAPARFDSSPFEVIQNFSISRDGTKIPYFLIKRKDLVLNGKNPTLLYGYGGFESSETPYYMGTTGKAWLERGGVYVVANIRGGGEYGPSWHQAALKENRQKAYDDFISVAEDLIARKITSPAHLGIQGGSNGGLLVGATMVQRPDLFNAALIQVPLLDMVRYSKLLAGASWVGEYGDPEDPKMCEYLLTYSPFHNVKPGKKYPVPMFTTSTKDDRVHPAHARKMAARMSEQGHRFYYYESTNGGHAGSATQAETAYMYALEYSYLWSRLK